MRPTVPLMMWGWIPLVQKLFQKFPAQRAAIASLILAWMFLPQYAYAMPGLPDYDKTAAAVFSILIATFIYAKNRFEGFQFDFQDAIVFGWCLTPMFASIDNGLGAYDGFAASRNYVTSWFIPYLVGRIYLRNWDGVRDLAWAIFFGGLIYLPLCCYEIVMSPQLHNKVYGWHPHDFIQSVRGNTFRPVIFMQHGLMVGMFMMSACFVGIQLWRSGQLMDIKPLLKKFNLAVHPRWIVIALLVVFVACKSMGATALLLQGWLILELCIRFKFKLAIMALILMTPLDMAMKISGQSSGEKMVEFIKKYNTERAASLEFRLINEEMLVDKALQRPVFGWGGWGRSRVFDENGKDIAVTDAYWVIVLGTTGIVGVVFFNLIIAVPAWRFLAKFPKDGWRNPKALLALPLVILLPLYAQDCMLNDMKSPIYMVIAGGLISLSQCRDWMPLPNLGAALAEVIRRPQLVTRYV